MKMGQAIMTMPTSVIRQVFTAFADTVNQQIEEGKTEAYYRPRDTSFVIISEGETVEDAYKTISKIPVAGIFDIEFDPLIDFNLAIKFGLENLEAGDDIMPGGTVK